MATQYEIEHNVRLAEPAPRRGRRVDMASFFSLLDRVSETPSSADPSTPHSNPHATPTPADAASLFRMLQDQLLTLRATAPTAANRDFLDGLAALVDGEIRDPPRRLRGVDQAFVDALERVPRPELAAGKGGRGDGDDCAICKIPYLDDKWCLVVELPCRGRHRFDLECVGPWLRSVGTCPMCREEMIKQKDVPVSSGGDGEDEEEDGDMMYA